MKMTLMIIVGIIALVFSSLGIYFRIKHAYEISSDAWCIATMGLWLILFIDKLYTETPSQKSTKGKL